MATKISGMTTASTLDGTESVELLQGVNTRAVVLNTALSNLKVVQQDAVTGALEVGGVAIAETACTWETAPAASGNTGLIVPITNVSESGYDLFISNGTRFYPLAGYVNLALWLTRVSVDTASSNEVDGTAISVLKIPIPYSTLNGSLFGNGDIIKMQIAHTRTTGGTGSIARSIYLGTHATLPLSNTQILRNTNSSTTNLYVAEEPSFVKINSTTIQPIGRQSLDQWSGPTATRLYNATDDQITGLTSMDANKVYFDIVLAHASDLSETVLLDYGLVQLISTGPVTG